MAFAPARLLLLSLLLPFGAAPAYAAAQAPAVAPSPARLPTTATGLVTDATTGEPIAGALVQQEGSVTSVFTQADGHYRLLLDRAGAATLVVSAVGYENLTLEVGDGRERNARLREVSGFVPSTPLAPLAPLGQSASETAPLNTGLIFAYRLRQNGLSATGSGGGTAAINGFSNNDFRLGLRYRLRPWLIDAEGGHFEMPVDVNGLRREDNPAFKLSAWQAAARAGLLFPLTSDLEGALQGAYRWTNTVPNNNDVRYTGTDLDFEQTRHAVGGFGTLAWRPGRGRFHLEGQLGFYPLVFANAKAPGAAIGTSNLFEARAIAGYELMPGLRLGLGVGTERWSGNGDDGAQLYSLQVHYTPGGVPKGNE